MTGDEAERRNWNDIWGNMGECWCHLLRWEKGEEEQGVSVTSRRSHVDEVRGCESSQTNLNLGSPCSSWKTGAKLFSEIQCFTCKIGVIVPTSLFYCEDQMSSVQFSSVAQSCLTVCNPMDCSTPGLPVYHQLAEFTQSHVHWVSDAFQLSHPLSSNIYVKKYICHQIIYVNTWKNCEYLRHFR